MIRLVITNQLLFSAPFPKYDINLHFPHHLQSNLNAFQHGSVQYQYTAANCVTYPDFITQLLYCQSLVGPFILTLAKYCIEKATYICIFLRVLFVTCCMLLSSFPKCQLEPTSEILLKICMI
jgi:hypothetical protein